MMRASRLSRPLILAVVGALGACSGSMSGCRSCASLTPIPGGFDPTAEIDRAIQARITSSGVQFIDASFQQIMGAYARLHCGAMGDVPCPTAFLDLTSGASDPSTCDAMRNVCVEQTSGKPGPLIGFQIQRTTSNNATICRDDPTQPNARLCYVWLRFEALNLTTQAPDAISAVVTSQIRTTDIPIYYSPLSMNCIVSVDSTSNPNHTQDFTLNAKIGKYAPPTGTGGGQLQVTVQSVSAMIPDGAVHIAADPVDGGILDNVLCAVANLGPVKGALIPQLTNRLTSVVSDTIDNDLGWKCAGMNAVACTGDATCNAKGLCQDSAGHVVPKRFGVEGRMDFSTLLGGLTASRPGQGDISFIVGGSSEADMAGLTIGALGGTEVVTPDPTCARILPSPRLRSGWMPPPAFPLDDLVDLGFTGTATTPFMVGVGVSDDIIEQGVWTIYTAGLFCQTISASQVDLLNTGSLSLLMPSLKELTHGDRYPSAIFPARISLQPGSEPVLVLGSGKVDRSGANPRLVDPLIALKLQDLAINFYAQVEERWVRLMTATVDLQIGLGAIVNPQNEIELVLGDITNAITNVRITNSEILADSPMDLASAIPSLVQLALPRLTQRLRPIALPSGMSLGGFVLDVLGIRGVSDGTIYRNVGIYANLSFDPSLAPQLAVRARTEARITAIRAARPEAFSVGNPGGPTVPEVEIELGGSAPRGEALEYQVRVDGGLWSPFFDGVNGKAVLSRPEFLAEGHHAIDVRARIRDQYRTLDPTPVALDAVIDVEPPRLLASLDQKRVGVRIEAYDVVSADRLRIEVAVHGVWRTVSPDRDGFVSVPEVADLSAPIAVAATDEQGLRAEMSLRTAEERVSAGAASSDGGGSGGCRCVVVKDGSGTFALIAALALALVSGKRRRRPKGQD